MATLRLRNVYGSNIYYVDFTYRGKRHRKSTKTDDRKLAELFLKDIEVKIARDAFGFDDLNKKKIRLAEFSEKYGEFSKATKAENTYLLDTHALRVFREFVGDTSLEYVKPQRVEEFKVKRLTKVKAVSVNLELRHLKAAFQTAVKWGYISENPFKGVKQHKIKGKNLPKYLTKEQVNALLAVIPDGLFKNLISFYLYTGCRRNEVLNLRWEDIDMNARRIIIRETKSGLSRIIPINDKLAEMLTSMTPNGDKLFLFTPWYVTHKFKKYLKTANISGSESLKLHSLRHTFASHLVMSGIDIYTVAKLLGHSSVAVTQMYAHLAPDYLKVSVERLQY